MQVVEVVGSDYAASCCEDNCDSAVPHERVDRNPCDVTIEVTAPMEPPVYMYYKLTDYFQNHRRYVRSRDDSQLKGDDDTPDCDYHVKDAGEYISPCGLIAWSVFNDAVATSTSPR